MIMNYDIVIFTNKNDVNNLNQIIERFFNMSEDAGIVVVGHNSLADKVLTVSNDIIFKDENEILSFSDFESDNSKFSITEKTHIYHQLLMAYYSRICSKEYYLVWESNAYPVRNIEPYKNDSVFIDYSDVGLSNDHMFVNTLVMREYLEKLGSDIASKLETQCTINQNLCDYSILVDYANQVISSNAYQYFLREWKTLVDGAKYFKIHEMTEGDNEWLAKSYDVIVFSKDDIFMPDYSFFLHNEEYRSKLLPHQVVDAINAENSNNYDYDSSAIYDDEYAFSAMIDYEISQGKQIIICPYKEEGHYFEGLLRTKYHVDNPIIVDDYRDDGVIAIQDLIELDTDNMTVIVNSANYDENIDYVIKISNLKKNIRVVSLFGAQVSLIPSKEEYIDKVRKLTQVYSVIGNKDYIRVGDDKDGGYIMLDDFNCNLKAYSYGINKDVTWDKQLADGYGMDIFMYDHTIDGLPEENEHFHFFKKGVAGEDMPEESLYSLETCLKDNNHLGSDNMILKMDVEGAEWQVINSTPSKIFAGFRQIAFELHELDHPNREAEIIKALEKLNETHFPVWVHGNNYVSAITAGDTVLPSALEILYLNRNVYEYEEKKVYFPWTLDAPNTEIFPEYILGNWGVITKSEDSFMNYEDIKNKILEDQDLLTKLSDSLLMIPSVYGPKDRVHLAQNTNLNNALLNTMSGSISIDEYTFCGHNVSIITGSHDVEKIKEDRMKHPDNGGNIQIGKGVWLANGATILGPCTIGNNAVVAAGAVVLPGTVIADNEVWAGVPATKKKDINIQQ